MKKNEKNDFLRKLFWMLICSVFFVKPAYSQIAPLKKIYSNPFAEYVRPILKNKAPLKLLPNDQPQANNLIPISPAFVQLPTPPNLGLTFSGRILDENGGMTIFASSQERLYKLFVGLTLPNGYVVQNITITHVGFSIPSQNIVTSLNLPPLPQFEIK